MELQHIQGAEISKLMSASIAPVFLITGIGSILSIMSLRYGRVFDRIRTLLREGPKLYQKELGNDHLVKELKVNYRRARILRVAIILETSSIFAISSTIFTLFFSLSFGVEVYFIPQATFIVSLILLMAGLLFFMHDFALSLACIEHDMEVRSELDMQREGNKPLFDSFKK